MCFFCTVPLPSSTPPLLNPSPPQPLPSSTPPLRNPSPLQLCCRGEHHELLFFWQRGFSGSKTQGARHSGSSSIWSIIVLGMMIADHGRSDECRIQLRLKKEAAHGSSRVGMVRAVVPSRAMVLSKPHGCKNAPELRTKACTVFSGNGAAGWGGTHEKGVPSFQHILLLVSRYHQKFLAISF